MILLLSDRQGLRMPNRLHSETFSDECLHPHSGRSALQALGYNSWKPYRLFNIHDNQQVLIRTHERLKSLLQTFEDWSLNLRGVHDLCGSFPPCL
ncbi:hypothetical protein [Laspinema palackyanum]|uniref:hypothetical protein n=1 Tax=Laspinema palackyanum TaxID=3231601 RepID=UPI00345C7885|nr:hypothetical protein [Laspinema sp. D2c]